MKTTLTTCLIAMCMFAVTSTVEAQRGQHNKPNHRNQVTVVRNNNPRKVVVKQYRHPRHLYYTHRQLVIVKARRPHVIVRHEGYARFLHRNVEYFFNDGWFYRNLNGAYTVVAPPFGLRIKVLPVGYRTVLFSGVPYIYHHGIYYLERPAQREYEVVEPAVGTIVPDLPNDDIEEVTMNGQTYYECNNVLYEPVTTPDGTQYKVAAIVHN